MRKILFVLLLFSSWNLSAQDTTAYKRTEEYADLIAQQKPLSMKFNYSIDYGQETSLWADNRARIDDGRLAEFNSTIDAMNYMNSKGWEFVNAIFTTNGAGGSAYHYIFKRKIK